jgi:hypothetical protein
MKPFAQAGVGALLLAGTFLYSGCGNSSAGLTTGSTSVLPPDAPTAMSNEDPMARPISVAWTAARAKRCAFLFDSAKLRTTYLGYESRQATGEQYAKIEKTYDATYRLTSEKISQEVDYCTDRKALQIKSDLERYLAGDYTPNLPKPKAVASCGFFGCPSKEEEPWDTKSFWIEKERNPSTGSH